MTNTAKRILVVTDHWAGDWLSQASAADEYHLLTCGISSERYLHEQRARLAPLRVSPVPVAPLAAEARAALQQDVPTILYQFARMPLGGGGSVLDRLHTSEANWWWLCEMSEKSVLRGPLINNLYYLQLVTLAAGQAAYDELWLCVRSQPLCDVLQRTAQHVTGIAQIRVVVTRPGKRPYAWPRFLLQLVVRRCLLSAYLGLQYLVLRAMRVPGPAQRCFIFTNYPTNWRQPYGDKPTDRLFDRCAQTLSAWRPTGYLGVIHLMPWRLWWHRHILRRNFERLAFVPLLLYGGWSAIAAALHPRSLRMLFRADRAVSKLECIAWAGWNIGPLLRAEFQRSLLGMELPLNVVWMRCLRRFCRAHVCETVVHTAEFQPVEKALWYGTRESGAVTVAFQHSTCTPMFLNYHFAAGELQAYLQHPTHPHAMPLPTLFATTGHYAAEALVTSGFPVHRVRVCGALRYRGLMELCLHPARGAQVRQTWGWSVDETVLVVALATKQADNDSLLESLAAVLPECSRQALIVVKSHPLGMAASLLVPRLQLRFPQIRFQAASGEAPLHELLAATDVFITNSSASGLEALALGKTPIFFHNPHLYDVSFLYSLPKEIFFAASAPELRAVLCAVLQRSRPAEAMTAQRRAILEYAFCTIDTEADRRLVHFLAAHQQAAARLVCDQAAI